MPEYVSSLEAASGVLGRTSLPSTTLSSPDQQPQQQPQFGQPQRTVDTDSLLNQAIQARQNFEAQHQNIENQRTRLARELASTPLGRHGRTTPRALALQSQLHGLDVQQHNLGQQEKFQNLVTQTQVSAAFRNASMSHKLAQDDLTRNTAEQAGQVFLKGTEIFNKYKPGDPRINEEMSQLRDQYPLGFNSMAVKGHFGKVAAFHDQEAERQQKQLETSLFRETKLSPEQFAAATNIRATKAPIGSNVDAIEKQRADKGAQIAFDVDGVTHLMAKSFFDNLSKRFRQQPSQSSVASVPQTPDADTYAQSQGFRDAAQYAQWKSGGRLVQPTSQPQVAPVGGPPVIPANTSPIIQIGERRTIGGIPAEWDGKGWKKVTQ